MALKNDRDRLALLSGCPLQPVVLPPPSPRGTHLCWNPPIDLAEAREAKFFALRYNRNLGRTSAKQHAVVLRGFVEPL